VTLCGRDNATHFADVLHGVLEENERHHGVDFVVLSECQAKHLSHLLKIMELIVQLVVKRLGEVSEHKGLGVVLLEVLGEVEFAEILLA